MEKKAGASRRQTRRAHDRASATPIVQQEYRRVQAYRQFQHDEQLRRNFRFGLCLGLAIGLGVMALLLWLWVIPTMDGCVEQVKQMAVTA